jgi:hypothetical protein
MIRKMLPAVAAALLMLSMINPTVNGNGPDPEVTSGQAYWDQNEALQYDWLAGFVPPATTMQPAITAGAEDSDQSQVSKAPLYSLGSGEGAVAYGKTGTGWSCGPQGIACFHRSVGSWFHVNFRVHGEILTNPDGSKFTVRWCQINASGSCWDAENVALDEFGHVLGLGHHVNPDRSDAVVQAVSLTGTQPHAYAKCDVARLQLGYDISETDPVSNCLITDGDGLNTTVTLSASPTSVSEGDPVLFTAHLTVVSSTTYKQLSGNNLTNRSVSLYRALPGSTSWTLIGAMTGSAGGIYKRSVTQGATTYQWQARFAPAAAEGLDADNSPALTVNVQPCDRIC